MSVVYSPSFGLSFEQAFAAVSEGSGTVVMQQFFKSEGVWVDVVSGSKAEMKKYAEERAGKSFRFRKFS